MMAWLQSPVPDPIMKRTSAPKMHQGPQADERSASTESGLGSRSSRGNAFAQDRLNARAPRDEGRPAAFPFLGRVQEAFGHHSLAGLSAMMGAEESTAAHGAPAILTDEGAAFAGSPTLHQAAHEAAHFVQRAQGVGPGPASEAHANAVADAVVAGQSAVALLDRQPAGGGGGRGGTTGSVYTYTRVPAARQAPDTWQDGTDLRVADDGSMAVRDVGEANGQVLYADSSLIAQAENMLLGMDSPLSLRVGNTTLTGPAPDGGRLRRLNKVEMSHRDTRTHTDGDTPFTTRENCNHNALNIFGLDEGGAQRESHQYHWSNPNGPDLAYNHLGGAGADIATVCEVRQQVGSAVSGDDPNTIDKTSQKELYQELHGATGRTGRRRRDQVDQSLGINAFAQPEMGDMLEVYRNTEETTGFTAHFAPVIMKSGGDSVTLENYARSAHDPNNPNTLKNRGANDTVMANSQWFFRMCGPSDKDGEDQSFYGENVREGSYGGQPGTMVLRWQRGER